MVKLYLSFHNSSSFALRYFLNVNGKAIVWVSDTPLDYKHTADFSENVQRQLGKKKGEFEGHQAIHPMNNEWSLTP